MTQRPAGVFAHKNETPSSAVWTFGWRRHLGFLRGL